MMPNPVHRLPAPLEAAVQSLKLASRGAVELTIKSLGLAALASSNAFQRDGLLGSQFELNRKSAVFILTFNDAFDERVTREVGAPPGALPSVPVSTRWDTLSLVENHEVELQISAERFGLEIAHACEWELRELSAYVASLLSYGGTESERNPLRPEIVGHAMIRGVEAVSERAEIRKVLAVEIGRSLASMLPLAYAEIVADLRQAGVQPMGLSLRTSAPRSPPGARSPSGLGGLGGPSRDAEPDDSRSGQHRFAGPAGAGYDSHYGARRSSSSGLGPPSSRSGAGGARHGTPLGQVDPALMTLIRRLAYIDGGSIGRDSGHDSGYAEHGGAAYEAPLPNLIHAHRDELRQASTGSLDHMVIDVIGSLFEQILSDPKVPPQMARQIARLQLPVLRAALGDPTFFSSRRHPVRRFVNRIASLGAAFEDFSDEAAQRFLAKVRALVQEVVEGDFDQIETYEHKLTALEVFVIDQATSEVLAQGDAAELLSQKEDEQRLRQLYAQRLEGDLKGLAGPEFVRDFISRVWSRVLLHAAGQGGVDDPLAARLRRAGRELFMSVQPKATPAHRKTFLAELPKLMQDLTTGMNLIGWPEAQRRAFFGQLMPAHAEALKSTGLRQLDINLLARQVEGALERPLPSRDELKAAPPLPPVLTDEVDSALFSAEEAQRIGLVDEASVDWDGKVDIELDGEPEPAGGGPAPAGLPGIPEAADAAEPLHGRGLADHVQIGFAYQMHVRDAWQKVRLSHVSPARRFFVFTHGQRHKQTISLTQRMLVRLCETGRLRAFEPAYLIERATARARRQLAAVGGAAVGRTVAQ